MEALGAAALSLVVDVVKLIIEAAKAKDERDHEAIMARVLASKAALAGDKAEAHAKIETVIAESQAVIDAASKK